MEEEVVDVANLHCKFCRRSPVDCKWAREGNQGKQCADCRNLLRRCIHGTLAERTAKLSSLELECRTQEGHQHYMDTALTPWLQLEAGHLRGQGLKKHFALTPMRTMIEKVCQDGFVMEEVRGVFWPCAIYHKTFGRLLHPHEIKTVRGQQGAILPEKPGEVLPIGVFRLFNSHTEGVERRDTLEDSSSRVSRLFDGQIDAAHDSLQRKASSTMAASMTWSAEGFPVVIPPEDGGPQQKEQEGDGAKRKRRRKTAAPEPEPNCSDESDDWFDGIPKEKAIHSQGTTSTSGVPLGRNKSKKAPAACRSRADSSKGGTTDATCTVPLKRRASIDSNASTSATAGTVEDWRSRAAKGRKVAQVAAARSAADGVLMHYSSVDVFHLQPAAISACIKKLQLHLDDEKLTALFREKDGSISDEGLKLRVDVSHSIHQMQAVTEVLAAVSDFESASSIGSAGRLQTAVCEAESLGLKSSTVLLEKVVRCQNKSFLAHDKLDLCILYMTEEEEAAKKVSESVQAETPSAKECITLLSLQHLEQDVRRKLKHAMLYDIVTLLMWDKDAEPKASAAIAALVKHKQMWPDDVEALGWIHTCMSDFGAFSMKELISCRAGTKSAHKLMRQFVNLPLGARRVAELDAYILESKKVKVMLDCVESVQHSLQAAESIELLKGRDPDKLLKHYGHLRNTFLATLANVNDTLLQQHQGAFNPVIDAFDKAVVHFGICHSILFEERLLPILEDVIKCSADTKFLKTHADQIKKSLKTCQEHIVTADASGVRQLGTEVDVRDWTLCTNTQSRLLLLLELVVNWYLVPNFKPSSDELRLIATSAIKLCDARAFAKTYLFHSTKFQDDQFLLLGGGLASKWESVQVIFADILATSVQNCWKPLQSNFLLAALVLYQSLLVSDAPGAETPEVFLKDRLSVSSKKKFASVNDNDIAHLEVDIDAFCELAAAAGDTVFKGELKVGKVHVSPARLRGALKLGQVVRAFCALQDRCENVDAKSLEVLFIDPNAEHAVASMWDNIGQDLLALRTRLSNSVIEANKTITEDWAMDLTEWKARVCGRTNRLLSLAPDMCRSWLDKVGPASFEEVETTLKENLGKLIAQHPDIFKLAETAPIDLERLSAVAKAPVSKILFLTWQSHEAAVEAHRQVSKQYKAASIATSDVQRQVVQVMSIFMATQAVQRKLKNGETRADIVKATKANIAESGGAVPPALLLVLDSSGVCGAAPPSEAAPEDFDEDDLDLADE